MSPMLSAPSFSLIDNCARAFPAKRIVATRNIVASIAAAIPNLRLTPSHLLTTCTALPRHADSRMHPPLPSEADESGEFKPMNPLRFLAKSQIVEAAATAFAAREAGSAGSRFAGLQRFGAVGELVCHRLQIVVIPLF